MNKKEADKISENQHRDTAVSFDFWLNLFICLVARLFSAKFENTEKSKIVCSRIS